LAFSWNSGLLLFSPALLLALVAIPEWFRRQPRDAGLILAAAGLYIAVMASSAEWWGGTNYSARLIVPIVPLLFAPLAVGLEFPRWKSDWRVQAVGGLLIVFSIEFGAIGAFGWHVRHPPELQRAP
jgi:hypothetical protein